jgi:hypothetical protein
MKAEVVGPALDEKVWDEFTCSGKELASVGQCSYPVDLWGSKEWETEVGEIRWG